MKKTLIVWSVAIGLFAISCGNNVDSSIDGNVKRAFNTWAKDNLSTKYRIQSIVYDTVGCPMDFMFSATMLGQTIGSSGHSDSEINIGGGLIMLDCYLDSTLLTKNIHIAEISLLVHDTIETFYVGMRGDSICTSPQKHGYEALFRTHSKGEQRLYDACYEIYCNLNDYAVETTGRRRGTSKEDYYEFWISLPSYEEALGQTEYNVINGN